MSTSKPRINVTLSEDLYLKLKIYAENIGMTTSGLAALFINASILSYEKTILKNVKEQNNGS